MTQRIRIHYSKSEILRFTSTLDMQKMWERILRRAGLPIVYSKGFHPQPKIQLACPLPLGLTSKSEIVDFWLETEFCSDMLLIKLHDVLNNGINISLIENIPTNEPAMQNRLISAVYRADLDIEQNFDEIAQEIIRILNKNEMIRIRRNKEYNLRPLIRSLELKINIDSGQPEIWMKLSIKPGGPHGRPDEVLDELGLDPLLTRIERIQLEYAPHEI